MTETELHAAIHGYGNACFRTKEHEAIIAGIIVFVLLIVFSFVVVSLIPLFVGYLGIFSGLAFAVGVGSKFLRIWCTKTQKRENYSIKCIAAKCAGRNCSISCGWKRFGAFAKWKKS